MCKVSALQCTSAFLTDEVDDNGRKGKVSFNFPHSEEVSASPYK